MSDVDYEVFNSFLKVETWHTSHPLDDKRFFLCLNKLIEEPNFSAEAMGDFMREIKGVNSPDHHYAERIDDLVSKAWAVREYLAANNEVSAYEDPDVQV